MTNNDWNPNLYLKFDKERTQPSIDLVSRIDFENPGNIIDIGCGPGNSTQVLARRWPDAKITGIDKSSAMIEKARNDYPDQNWKVIDAENISLDKKYDIVFSNATMQWIPDHENLLAKFKSLLTSDGVLAVQIPLFWDMPIGKSILELGENDKWKCFTGNVKNLFIINDYQFYYNILSNLFSSVDIWVTYYMHVLEGHETILEMMKSTGLKPYLESIHTVEDKNSFILETLNSIKRDYPSQKNGKVLFPFKRLFFIAEQK